MVWGFKGFACGQCTCPIKKYQAPVSNWQYTNGNFHTRFRVCGPDFIT